MRSLILCVALLVCPPLFAQTGPAKARSIASAPLNFPHINNRNDMTIIVDLTIATDGSVADAKISQSSGIPDADEAIRKFYLKQRFIPALDEKGTPIVGTSTGRYFQQGKAPPQATPAPDEEHTATAVDRIDRMKCKDFLWEYDIMKDVVHQRRLSFDEQLFRMSFAMYVSREKVPDAQISGFAHSVVDAMEASAKICRNKADDAFFTGVFVPSLQSIGPHR